MKVIKVNASDLKVLKDSPIVSEDCSYCPLTIVNENMEVLFGMNYVKTDVDMEVLQIECGSETASLEMAFFLHHLGMRTLLNCKNFNKLSNLSPERLGCPYGLYMYNVGEFNKELEMISCKLTNSSSTDLF